MNCENYKNIIPEYISDELDGNIRIEFEAHIKDCADCRNDLKSERSILALINEDIHEVPSGLNESVLSKLPAGKPVFHMNFMRYAVAASFFFLVMISYFMFNPTLETETKPVSSVQTENLNGTSNLYSSDYLIGSDYDELITYNAELYDEDKWTSDDTDIFQSEDDLINDLLTLEELESYDDYLTSL